MTRTDSASDPHLLALPDEPVAWGYARVSTAEQSVAAQVDALMAAGVPRKRIVTETASGARDRRPGLAGLLRMVRAGDSVTVWKLDRLGRSTSHLVATLDDLGQRGVHFRSLTDGIDTATAGGRLVFGVLASIAQFERDLIVERTNAGLARARREGKTLGRPSTVGREQYRLIHRLHHEGVSHRRIAASVGISASAVGRVLRGELPELDRRYGDVPDDLLR